MSIVVAVHKNGRTAVAADTIHYYGSRREHADNVINRPKVRRIGRALLGGVGWSVYDNIINHHLKDRKRAPSFRDEHAVFEFFLKLWRTMREKYQVVNDQPNQDDRAPFADIDSEFLVASSGGIFQIDANLTVTRYAQYVAIGSGDRYAFGSLYATYGMRLSAKVIAERAVEAATHFDQSCGGRIEVWEV